MRRKKVKVLFLLSYFKKIKVGKRTLDLEMLSMKGKRYKRQTIFSAPSQKPNEKNNKTMQYNDKEYNIFGNSLKQVWYTQSCWAY